MCCVALFVTEMNAQSWLPAGASISTMYSCPLVGSISSIFNSALGKKYGASGILGRVRLTLLLALGAPMGPDVFLANVRSVTGVSVPLV